jgi:DNA-binding NtrC family response regulator/tetratricopeptide (TPR) repeat protein
LKITPLSMEPSKPSEVPIPFAGRDEELAQLRGCRERMLRGEPSVVLLAGEAGAGKTRLAEVFGARVEEGGDLFLRGQAVEMQGADPYLPLVKVLDGLLGIGEEMSLEERRIQLDVFLEESGIDPHLFSPFLSEILLKDLSEHRRFRESSELRRHVLFEGVVQLLQAVSRERPVCIFLDDMQWAASALFELLDYLVEELRRERVLFLLAYRSEEVTRGREGRAHPLGTRQRRWITDREGLRLEVGRLSPEAVVELVEKLHLQGEWVDGLHQQTEGLALFVAEQVKMHLYGAGSAEGERPLRSQRIIDYRLDCLAPEDRTTLRCAALLGERFNGVMVAATLGEKPAHVLHRLERMREVHRLLIGEENLGYRFTHARIREKLIDELSSPLRRSYFLAAGEVLEGEGKTEGTALLDLAYWFREGGDVEQGSRYGIRAALQLLGEQASREAYLHACDAVELLEEGGVVNRALLEEVYSGAAEVMLSQGTAEGRDRAETYLKEALSACDEPLRRADLYCRMADLRGSWPSAWRTGHLDAAELEIGKWTDSAQMARVLVRRGGDDIRADLTFKERARELFERHAPDDPELFRVYKGILVDLAALEKRETLEERTVRLQELVQEKGDIVLTLQGYGAIVGSYHQLGEYRREVEAYEVLLGLYQQIRHFPSLAGIHAQLIQLYSVLGEFERAAENAARMAELRRKLGKGRVFGMLVNAAYFASLDGRNDLAKRYLDEAVQDTRIPQPHPGIEALQEYHEFLGRVEWIYWSMGRPDEARRFFQVMRRKERERGVRVERCWWAETQAPDEEKWRRLEGVGFAGDEWEWEDPYGVCRYDLKEGELNVCVTEIMGFNELTFPRLVREVEGDFALEVEVKSCEAMEAGMRERLAELREERLDRSLPFPGAAGLLAHDGGGNAVRIAAHVQTAGDVFFDGRVEGNRPVYGRAGLHEGGIVLRLEREGGTFRGYCRTGEQGWRLLGEIDVDLGRRVRVGPCAEMPVLFVHLARRAETRFNGVRLYRSDIGVKGESEKELWMLRELAEVAVDGEGEVFEHALLRALARAVEAEWGQFVERDRKGNWRVRLQWGGGGENGFFRSMKAIEGDEVQVVDEAGQVVCLPLEGREAAWLLGRERPFEVEERELLGHAGRIVRVLLEKKRLEEELRARRVRPVLVERMEGRSPQIVGQSQAMKQVFAAVEQVARSAAPVLIQGESGTGKELIARAIHDGGPRKERSFVAQNCAALPESLLESELFGYKKGAFTGATADKPGLFEVANGGTIFLDEIADASPAVQAKLLRAVEEGEIRRVGDTVSRKVDVRIVSATSRDLAEHVEQGRLREDLFYRLNVVRVLLPPLRERVEDVPALAEHFLRNICERDGKQVAGFTQGALDLLCVHGWPGNVRELQNEVERCAARVGENGAIEVEHLSAGLRGIEERARRTVPASGTLSQMVAHVERRAIRQTLEQCEGNISRAARELGVSRPGLKGKMERYGLG